VGQVCTKRQLDEPYSTTRGAGSPIRIDELRTTDEDPAASESVRAAARPPRGGGARDARNGGDATRSSSHTPVHEPANPGRKPAIASVGCERGAAPPRASPHFPRMRNGRPAEQADSSTCSRQLMFNRPKPMVAQCEEVVVHWDAPPDTCAQAPGSAPAAARRTWRARLGAPACSAGARPAARPRRSINSSASRVREDRPAAQRIASFQCLMFDPAAQPAAPVER